MWVVPFTMHKGEGNATHMAAYSAHSPQPTRGAIIACFSFQPKPPACNQGYRSRLKHGGTRRLNLCNTYACYCLLLPATAAPANSRLPACLLLLPRLACYCLCR